MFEDCGFEVYEGTTKTYQIKEVYEEIDGPSREMLQVREVLDDIKKKFYEIEEITSTMDQEVRRQVGNRWVQYLRKLTGPIRQQGAQQALQELRDDDHNMELVEGYDVGGANDYCSEEEEG